MSGFNIPKVYGTDVSKSDFHRILDTCGTARQIPRAPHDGLIAMDNDERPGSQYLRRTPITAAGGRYRLCWCPKEMTCSEAEHFRTDFGVLTLRGPAPLTQDRTCTSGQTCRIGDLTGELLQDEDRFLVLDTCGDRTATIRGGFANGAVSTSGAVVEWGAALTTGGQYRLCWCAGIAANSTAYGTGLGCSTAERFKVDLGELTLRGPSSRFHSFTCVSGQTCLLDGIVGQDLGPGDQVMALDTCSSSGWVMGSEKVGVVGRFAGTAVSEVPTQSGASVYFSGAEISAAGGAYRRCIQYTILKCTSIYISLSLSLYIYIYIH